MMEKLIVFVMLVPSFVSVRQSDSISISGNWNLTIETAQGKATPAVVFAQEGEKLTGSYIGRMGKTKLEGSIKGGEIKFTVTLKFEAQSITATYSGTVNGDAMKGTVQFSNGGSGSWTARRAESDQRKSSISIPLGHRENPSA